MQIAGPLPSHDKPFVSQTWRSDILGGDPSPAALVATAGHALQTKVLSLHPSRTRIFILMQQLARYIGRALKRFHQQNSLVRSFSHDGADGVASHISCTFPHLHLSETISSVSDPGQGAINSDNIRLAISKHACALSLQLIE